MVVDIIEIVGELHIVAIHGLEHMLTVRWNRELNTLKNMSC